MKHAFCVIIITGLVGLFGPALHAQDVQASSFAEQVDLSPLGRLAVQSNGRLKSYESHAHTIIQQISGPHEISPSRGFTYLDMIFRPSAYRGRDVIYIRNASIRAQIAEAVLRASGNAGDASQWVDSFQRTGLLSEQVLGIADVQQLLMRLRGDLVSTAKYVQAIEAALTYKDDRVLRDLLRMIPPPGGSETDPWLTLDRYLSLDASATPSLDTELQASIQQAWDQLAIGWMSESPETVNQAAKQLTSLIPQINPGLYPEPTREGWPWRLGGGESRVPWGVASLLTGVLAALSLTGILRRWTHGILWSTLFLSIVLFHGITLSLGTANPLELESLYFRNMTLVTMIWVVYAFSIVFLLLGIVYRWTAARWIGIGIFALAFMLQTGALLLRWYVADRWPNSNMFEAVTTAAWFGGCCAIILEILSRSTAMRSLFALGSAVASMAALMAAHFLPLSLDANISNRMPVLHDVWLYIHTNVIIFSYCLIAMAAITALLYLGYRGVALFKSWDGTQAYARVGGAGSFIQKRGDGSSLIGPVHGSGAASNVAVGRVFDGATMVLMELSFVLLWAGLVMGAIWADHSWGRPWGWDPKEVFALNTFLVFAVLVHVRLKVRDKGLWTALIALFGCAVMLFNWIVINFVVSGLHSYA